MNKKGQDFRKKEVLVGFVIIVILILVLGGAKILSSISELFSSQKSELKDTVHTETAPIQDKLEAIQKNIDVINGNIKSLESNLASRESVESLKNNQANTDAQISELKKEVSDLNGQFKIIQNNIASINPSITNEYSYYDYRRYFNLQIAISIMIGLTLGFTLFSMFGFSLFEKQVRKIYLKIKNEKHNPNPPYFNNEFEPPLN